MSSFLFLGVMLAFKSFVTVFFGTVSIGLYFYLRHSKRKEKILDVEPSSSTTMSTEINESCEINCTALKISLDTISTENCIENVAKKCKERGRNLSNSSSVSIFVNNKILIAILANFLSGCFQWGFYGLWFRDSCYKYCKRYQRNT